MNSDSDQPRPQPTYFLHGLESSSQGTKAQYFADHYPQVLSPDFSGGLQDRLASLMTICQEQQDLIFIGSSFGGLMATCFALANPAQVARLILLAPALNFADYQPPGSLLEVPTTLIIGTEDEVCPPALVLPLAMRTFADLHLLQVADDHLLHKTFTGLDWPNLLGLVD